MSFAWNGFKPAKRKYCYPCGPIIKQVLEQEGKKVDLSHLAILEV